MGSPFFDFTFNCTRNFYLDFYLIFILHFFTSDFMTCFNGARTRPWGAFQRLEMLLLTIRASQCDLRPGLLGAWP